MDVFVKFPEKSIRDLRVISCPRFRLLRTRSRLLYQTRKRVEIKFCLIFVMFCFLNFQTWYSWSQNNLWTSVTIGACFIPCSLSHASSLGKKMCKNYKIWNTLYEVGQIYCKQHDLIPICCPFCETKFRKLSLSKELGNIYVTHDLKKQPGKELRWICNLDFWCYINCKFDLYNLK